MASDALKVVIPCTTVDFNALALAGVIYWGVGGTPTADFVRFNKYQTGGASGGDMVLFPATRAMFIFGAAWRGGTGLADILRMIAQGPPCLRLWCWGYAIWTGQR